MTFGEKESPLRCGVSSFGFSGTNAHVVLEEYVPAKTVDKRVSHEPHLFVLSAATERALDELVRTYHEYLTDHTDVSIQQICYTASTGRANLDYRLAIVITSTQELHEKLHHIAMGKDKLPNVYFGYAKKDKTLDTDHLYVQGKAESLNELGQLYTLGAVMDWERFYNHEVIRKIPLPLYPFEQKRCWIEVKHTIPAGHSSERNEVQIEMNTNDIELKIKTSISRASGLKLEELDHQAHFLQMGLDSIILVQIQKEISELFRLDIPMEMFFETLTNINSLVKYVSENIKHHDVSENINNQTVQEHAEQQNLASVNNINTAKSSGNVSEQIVMSAIQLMESQLKSLNVLLGEQMNTVQSPLLEMKHHETKPTQEIQPYSESKEEKNLLYRINR